MDKEKICEIAKGYRDTESLGVGRLYRPGRCQYCITGALLNEAGVPEHYLINNTQPGTFRVPFFKLPAETMHAIARHYSRAALRGQEDISAQGILMVLYGVDNNEIVQLMEANDYAAYTSDRTVYDCLMDLLACDGEDVQY